MNGTFGRVSLSKNSVIYKISIFHCETNMTLRSESNIYSDNTNSPVTTTLNKVNITVITYELKTVRKY